MRRDKELQKIVTLLCKVHNLYFETERGILRSLFSKNKDKELKSIIEDIKRDLIYIIELKKPARGNKIFTELHPERLQEHEIMELLD